MLLADVPPKEPVTVDIVARSGSFAIDTGSVAFLLIGPAGEPLFDIPVIHDGFRDAPEGRIAYESAFERRSGDGLRRGASGITESMAVTLRRSLASAS